VCCPPWWSSRPETAFDIYFSRCCGANHLPGTASTTRADSLVAQLLFSRSRRPRHRTFRSTIQLTGGSFTRVCHLRHHAASGLMWFTICYGLPQNGAFPAAPVDQGKRLALPSARISFHQPMGGFCPKGQAVDLEIQAGNPLTSRTRLNRPDGWNTPASHAKGLPKTNRSRITFFLHLKPSPRPDRSCRG